MIYGAVALAGALVMTCGFALLLVPHRIEGFLGTIHELVWGESEHPFRLRGARAVGVGAIVVGIALLLVGVVMLSRGV
jgi:hypothetical protein